MTTEENRDDKHEHFVNFFKSQTTPPMSPYDRLEMLMKYKSIYDRETTKEEREEALLMKQVREKRKKDLYSGIDFYSGLPTSYYHKRV